MDIKSFIPNKTLMSLFCNTLGDGLLMNDTVMLYNHSKGIYEDTPMGDPAFAYFQHSLTGYQRLCTYKELLANPESKNVALAFNPTRVADIVEVLNVYKVPHKPYRKTRTGMLRTMDEGVVADIYDPSVSDSDRAEVLEFLQEHQGRTFLVYRPLHF